MSKQRKSYLAVVVLIVFVAAALSLLPLGVNIYGSAATQNCEGDFDSDGDVDGSDLALFAADFGRTDCESPPPCLTLCEVLQRGEVRVGVRKGDLAGFCELQSDSGLEVDLARALAAAIFGDKSKVGFVQVSASDRFTELQKGSLEVLVRITTFTLNRDASLNLNFGPTYFYDGQRIMTHSDWTLMDLEGKKIAVLEGSAYQEKLAKYMQQKGLSYQEVLYSSSTDMFSDYEAEQTDAVSIDTSILNANRSLFSDPDGHIILDDLLSKEPLSPVVRHGDDGWYDIVKWVIYALFQAEELGVDSGNVDTLLSSTSDPDIRRFLGLEGTLGQNLDLPDDWAYQIIKQVGNYAEIYEANFGPSTPTHLPRGQNSLHTDGGLLYSPPMR
jgi:general L-amino acid transport system substrate-binding protein